MKDEKPRERLIKYGVKNLSLKELIMLNIKSGSVNNSYDLIAEEVLKNINDVHDLKDISLSKLENIKGIGRVKAINLIASIELGRRVYEDKVNLPKNLFDASQQIFLFFKNEFKNIKQECFYCLYLDNKNQLINYKLLFMGTVNMSLVHPREVFKEAYLLSASKIICVHNHPSGNVAPSFQDMEITKKLKEIGQILDIKLIDHIIIGTNNYYSFYENKTL